jgi:hypothetical protein
MGTLNKREIEIKRKAINKAKEPAIPRDVLGREIKNFPSEPPRSSDKSSSKDKKAMKNNIPPIMVEG